MESVKSPEGFPLNSLNSLSVDHSVAKSLERTERLVCPEELSVQVGNHLLIHYSKERFPLLQLQHIEITLLYDSMCLKWGLTSIL